MVVIFCGIMSHRCCFSLHERVGDVESRSPTPSTSISRADKYQDKSRKDPERGLFRGSEERVTRARAAIIRPKSVPEARPCREKLGSRRQESASRVCVLYRENGDIDEFAVDAFQAHADRKQLRTRRRNMFRAFIATAGGRGGVLFKAHGTSAMSAMSKKFRESIRADWSIHRWERKTGPVRTRARARTRVCATSNGPELGVISLTRIRSPLKFIHVKQAFMDQVSALFIICFTLSESRDEGKGTEGGTELADNGCAAACCAPRRVKSRVTGA